MSDLDELVGVKVMGWTPMEDADRYPNHGWADSAGKFVCHAFDFKPSTKIHDAWALIKQIVAKDGMLDHIQQRDEKEWAVQFCAKPNEAWCHVHAYGETPEIAICKAALRWAQEIWKR